MEVVPPNISVMGYVEPPPGGKPGSKPGSPTKTKARPSPCVADGGGQAPEVPPGPNPSPVPTSVASQGETRRKSKSAKPRKYILINTTQTRCATVVSLQLAEGGCFCTPSSSYRCIQGSIVLWFLKYDVKDVEGNSDIKMDVCERLKCSALGKLQGISTLQNVPAEPSCCPS